MNILFVTNKNVYPLIGGIERITYVLARTFCELYDWKSYSLFTQENSLNQTTNDVFVGKYLLPDENKYSYISQIIDSQKIQVIISQGADTRVNAIMPDIKKACDVSKQHPAILFVYHNMPGFELVGTDVPTLMHKCLWGKNQRGALRQLFIQCIYSIFPTYIKSLIRPKYRIAYEASDKMIMLSEGFIEQYDQFIQGDKTHYMSIPNMLTYAIDPELLHTKKKTILIVARMEERQKRIKMALRIWKRIPLSDWQLKIIGDGEDLSYYKQLTAKWHLKNVSFEGQQDPLLYYRESSIFMMTSAFEGWPMTLMEAIPCGCVPIAFDSFSAVHDIIQSGRNGYIMPNNDIDGYARALQELMNNESLRAELAANAQKDVLRFSRENIAKQWKTLFENL